MFTHSTASKVKAKTKDLGHKAEVKLALGFWP